MLTQLKLAPLLVAALMMPTGCRSRHHILSTTQGFPRSSHLGGRNVWGMGACQFPKGSDSPGG